MSTSQANNEQHARTSVQTDCMYTRDRFLKADAGKLLNNAQGSTPWVQFTTLRKYKHCTSESRNQHKSGNKQSDFIHHIANHSPIITASSDLKWIQRI